MDHLPWGSSEKTWCFWRRENEWIYPEIQVASWAEVEIILADQSSVKTKLHKYQYTQINSQDFFSFHQKFFLDFPVTFIQASIEEIKVGSIRTTVGEIQAKHVFSSVSPPAKETHDLRLKQHFFGWNVQMTQPYFSPNCLTLMDLSVPLPNDGMAFMYVLPYSETQALVEFTVFSPTAWPIAVYQDYLTAYLEARGCWEVVGSEEGVIPMYGGRFPSATSSEGIQWIGGAGGQIKPSTGYAFYRIWEQTQRQVARFYGETQTITKKPARFRAYDLWLLHILFYRPARSIQIFNALFSKVPLERTFKFLNEQTSLWEEVLLFSKLPKRLFLRAVWDRLPNIIS